MIIKGKQKILFIPLGMLMFMCLGTIYSWSVFKGPLEILFDVNSTLSGIPYMLFLFFYAITMPFAGKYVEKIGPRKTSMIGGVILAFAWIASGFTHNIYLLSLTYGIFGGIGVGLVYGIPIAVAAKWFPNKKGLAVGVTLSGFGLSPFVTAPLSEILIDKYGLLNTFKILGLLFLVILIILSIPLEFPKNEEHHHSNKKIKHLNPKEMTKTKQFSGLWICYFIGTAVGLMIIGISSPVGKEVIGLSKEKAAMFVGFFAIFNGIGRPIFGILTDKIGSKKSAILSFISIVFAASLILFDKSLISFIVSFSIFWLNLGGWLSIAPISTTNIFGSKHYTRNYGIVFTAYGFGAVFGVLLSGFIKDKFNSYLYVFIPIIILSAIGIFIAYFMLDKLKNKE